MYEDMRMNEMYENEDTTVTRTPQPMGRNEGEIKLKRSAVVLRR